MKHAFVALCGCAAMASFRAGAQTTERIAAAQRLDEIASYYAKQGSFMGTVLVAEGDDVLLSKGYGYANLEWQNPQQPDAEFHLASLSPLQRRGITRSKQGMEEWKAECASHFPTPSTAAT